MKVLAPVGTFWIIRHKLTGGYLPELTKPVRGGYTHTEPTTTGKPRLFTTERGAKNALWWWLRGVLSVHMTAGDPYSDWGGNEPEEDWTNSPVATRKAEDMAVVKVDLSQVLEEIA